MQYLSCELPTGSYGGMVTFLCSSPFLNDFLKTALRFSSRGGN